MELLITVIGMLCAFTLGFIAGNPGVLKRQVIQSPPVQPAPPEIPEDLAKLFREEQIRAIRRAEQLGNIQRFTGPPIRGKDDLTNDDIEQDDI